MNANKSWDSIADRLSRILHYNNKSMTKTQYYQIDDSIEAIDTGDYKKAKDILFNIVHYHNKNLNKDVYFELDEILDDITTLYSGLGDGEEESISEDTVKQGNAWVNKGKEGTHGKFRTKKEADAQRKAMFANKRKGATFGEELNESAYEDFMNEIRSTYEYWRVSKILERAYNALPLEQYKKVYAEAQKVKDEIMAAHEGLKESSDYGVCKKCGKKLIPGENYYTMSAEKVCTDCGNKPDYSRLKPARKSVSGDYEDKILAKQELGEAKRQGRILYKGAAIYDGDYRTAENPPFYVWIDTDSSKIKQEDEIGFDTIEKAKAYIDDVRSKPHYLSKYERDYYSGPEEGGYTSEGLVLVDSKQFPDYDSAVKAFEKELNTYDKNEIEFEGNDVFADTYGWEYHIERRRGVDNSPAKSWAEAELGEDFVARQADEVLEGAVGNLSDKEVDKLLGTLRKAKKLLGVNRIEDIYYVQSEDDPEDWQRELEFTKENINSKVDFFNSKKYNISVVREKLDNGSVALYFADEDSVNRYHDITGNYYDDNFDYFSMTEENEPSPTFIETKVFSEKWVKYANLNDEDLYDLQECIIKKPFGDASLGNNVYKIRFSPKRLNHGRDTALRVWYINFINDGKVVLSDVLSKSDDSNITPTELKFIKEQSDLERKLSNRR